MTRDVVCCTLWQEIVSSFTNEENVVLVFDPYRTNIWATKDRDGELSEHGVMEVLEYFPGGVPPGTIFQMEVNNLRDIVEKSESSRRRNMIAEICLIALVAHFEAFCRGHFASLINICPQLLIRLKKKGQDVTIDSSDLVGVGSSHGTVIGFLVAERYNFGTAKKINTAYTSALAVTPFSKKEKEKYDRILADRNLLVHHGGVYTKRYAGQRFVRKLVKKRIYYDSLVISAQDFRDAADFLEKIAFKLITATKKSLEKFLEENDLKQTDEIRKAIGFLNWWET